MKRGPFVLSVTSSSIVSLHSFALSLHRVTRTVWIAHKKRAKIANPSAPFSLTAMRRGDGVTEPLHAQLHLQPLQKYSTITPST
jgi:hypothetical protein